MSNLALGTSRKREIKRSWLLGGVFVIWIGLAKLFNGKFTLEIAVPQNTPFTSFVGEVAKSIRGNRTDGAAFK
jgi:hypothetical protein